MKSTSETVVLLSGGIDSAACVCFYRERRQHLSGLFVDYGQIAATHEERAAKKIAEVYDVPLSTVRLHGARRKECGEVAGRNALLCMIALAEFRGPKGQIAIGLHSGTPYYDCTKEFLANVQSIADGYANDRVQFTAPLLSWNKKEIWCFCRNNNVPVEITYSCERGDETPCGECLSCRDMEEVGAITQRFQVSPTAFFDRMKRKFNINTVAPRSSFRAPNLSST